MAEAQVTLVAEATGRSSSPDAAEAAGGSSIPVVAKVLGSSANL